MPTAAFLFVRAWGGVARFIHQLMVVVLPPFRRDWRGVLLVGAGLITTSATAASSPDADVTALLRQLATDSLGTVATAEPVTRFFARTNYAPVWTQPAGPTSDARAGLALLQNAAHYGLPPAAYQVQPLQALLDSLDQEGPQPAARRARAEQQLTAALLRFTHHLHAGRITDSLLRPARPGKEPAFDAVRHLQQAVSSGHFAEQLLTAQPTSRSYVRLLWAWQRLVRTDSAAAQRVALPVALNLERLRWEPSADSLYVMVNIPAYCLQVVRGAQVVGTHRVIVGKAETPTPQLFSRITFMQAAPAWRVPQSIATREMLPRLQRDPGSLAEQGYALYTAAGRRVNPYRVRWEQVQPETFAYQIRQAPSADNALGNVVFRFANPYAVYLHDTPTKAAFKASRRALSHGCVRVEQPLALARFLLRRDNAEQADRRTQELRASLAQGRTTGFSLQAPVPLLVRYLTCDADGPQLRAWPDIYHLDEALAQAWQADLPPPPLALITR